MNMDSRETMITQCESIHWPALTDDQLSHVLDIVDFAGRQEPRKSATQSSAGGFVQSSDCMGGCVSLYGGLCGPCYRLNKNKVK